MHHNEIELRQSDSSSRQVKSLKKLNITWNIATHPSSDFSLFNPIIIITDDLSVLAIELSHDDMFNSKIGAPPA